MIEQGNKKGDLFDFAILYGKRNEKIFLGFQMIYYPVNENLYGKLGGWSSSGEAGNL